eukprot:4367209-Heterocapsa_arctica.AAC.1
MDLMIPSRLVLLSISSKGVLLLKYCGGSDDDPAGVAIAFLSYVPIRSPVSCPSEVVVYWPSCLPGSAICWPIPHRVELGPWCRRCHHRREGRRVR